MDINFIDLFAGVGGFHYAFNNKAKCVFSSEWDKNARETYLANWGEDLQKENADFAGDITKVNYDKLPNFDILCGGFPCQAFSIAGKKLGFNDTRGTLFFNILEIVKAKKPRVVFLENVKNLTSHDKGNTFKVILASLEELGYLVHHKVLNGSTHGNVPQNRERIFIVAFKNKKDFERFEFPKEEKRITQLKDVIDFNKKVDDKYYYKAEKSEISKRISEGVNKEETIYQFRRYYLREMKNGVCPTLTANMGTGGHNVPIILTKHGVRKLTPRECFSLQGYPKDFKLPEKLSNAALYKQAGNSVVVTVVKRIAENILKAIKD